MILIKSFMYECNVLYIKTRVNLPSLILRWLGKYKSVVHSVDLTRKEKKGTKSLSCCEEYMQLLQLVQLYCVWQEIYIKNNNGMIKLPTFTRKDLKFLFSLSFFSSSTSLCHRKRGRLV